MFGAAMPVVMFAPGYATLVWAVIIPLRLVGRFTPDGSAAHPDRELDQVEDPAVLGADLEGLDRPGVGGGRGGEGEGGRELPRAGAPSAAVA